MCEYCGCQEVPAIALLTEEHDAVVNLIGEVRRHVEAQQLDAAVAGCADILRILDPHTRVEEEALFPAMRSEFGDQVGELMAEHRLIEAVLGEATSGAPADPTWPHRLLATLEQLRDHILKEQDGVFPASLAVLSPEDWDHVDQVRAEAPSALTPNAA